MHVRRRSSAITGELTVAALSTAITAGAPRAQDGSSKLTSARKARSAMATTVAAVLQTPTDARGEQELRRRGAHGRYQCRNPKGTSHYLTAYLAQDAEASYVIGIRSDTGGLLREVVPVVVELEVAVPRLMPASR